MGPALRSNQGITSTKAPVDRLSAARFMAES